MDGACRPRSFQSDEEVETQRGITLNNSAMLCKTNEMLQATSHDLPNEGVFGSIWSNTLRDSKRTVYTFREEKYYFRPGDGQVWR